MTIGLEKVVIETANGPEENLTVVKEVTIMDKPGSEIGKDHTLAKDVLVALGAAGYDQWYEEMKSRRWQAQYGGFRQNREGPG